MSELIQKNDTRATIRWKLLTGASALALTAYVSSVGITRAEDTARPQVWIELGGDLSQLNAPEEQIVPPFILATPRPVPEKISPLSLGNPLRFGFDENAKISFEPGSSDWVFSAGIRFGRAKGSKNLHQQSYPTQPILPPATANAYAFWQYALPFSDVEKGREERHTVLDFQAGKDVGFGAFGPHGTSTLSAGVRFAQFTSRTSNTFRTQPDWHASTDHCLFNGFCNLTGLPTFSGPPFKTLLPITRFKGGHYNLNAAMESASRSFHGVGPSISWNASAPIAGNTANGAIMLDWGVNAAILFGRQKAKVHHQTTNWYHPGGNRYDLLSNHSLRMTVGTPVNTNHIRSRNVTVPNVGGFAGISYVYDDAKISLGYRADFFFNAIDGGIDAAKKENRGFFGPYASISIGLGD